MKVQRTEIFNEETIRYTNKNGVTSIECNVNVINFIDPETKYKMAYIPSLEISGYGDTSKEATEMVFQTLEYYFKNLLSLSKKEVENEFVKYGWRKKQLKKKEYISTIDIKEVLVGAGIKDYDTSSLTLAA